jgi:superfamily I DNA/RNA helicase
MDRLRAFHEFGTTGEVSLWGLQKVLPLLKDAFRRGAKVRIERADEDEAGSWFDRNAESIMKSDEDMIALCSGDLSTRWFFEHAVEGVRKKLPYIRAITKRSGQESVFEYPQVVLSTIHSVKGASADRVFVFPDLSPAFYEQYMMGSTEEREAIQMMMYVAVTRTRDTLVLCEALDGKRTLEW